MEVSDPALLLAFFYPAGDHESRQLWQIVQAARPKDGSTVRRQRVTLNGATVVAMLLERDGVWEAVVWQELSKEMDHCLAQYQGNLPGRLWGASQFYLAGIAARPQDEQQLLREGLALPTECAYPMAALPVGRLWLVTPPAMAEGGKTVASYALIHTPVDGTRRRIESYLWGEGATVLRAELYLHRALHSLRQYGRADRTSLWTALDDVEAAAAIALSQPADGPARENLQRAWRYALPGLAHLSRRHHLLRSSAYLYRQICNELCPEEGTLFTWYQDRLNEALAQWGYDLERGDRAVALAHTALLAGLSPLPLGVGKEEGGSGRSPAQARDGGLRWPFYLIAAAIVALCVVDDSWLIVAARAGAVVVLTMLAWAGLRLFWRRR